MASLFERRSLDFEGEVDAAPLSAILRPEEMHNARLIKIDVEGGEMSVVAGMESLLSSGRTDLEIVIEVHPELLGRQGRRPEDLIALFQEHRFNSYIMNKDFYIKDHMRSYGIKRPVRIRSPIQWENDTDLIFSRQDSELL
jgi:hypothetical protein